LSKTAQKKWTSCSQAARMPILFKKALPVFHVSGRIKIKSSSRFGDSHLREDAFSPSWPNRLIIIIIVNISFIVIIIMWDRVNHRKQQSTVNNNRQ
jgi:hypothetical protein